MEKSAVVRSNQNAIWTKKQRTFAKYPGVRSNVEKAALGLSRPWKNWRGKKRKRKGKKRKRKGEKIKTIERQVKKIKRRKIKRMKIKRKGKERKRKKKKRSITKVLLTRKIDPAFFVVGIGIV